MNDNTSNNQPQTEIPRLIIEIIINYIKYLFLTGVVLFPFSILVMIIIMINPDYNFGIFQYFSIINPTYSQESFNIGTKEIMEMFGIIALIFYAITSIIKFLFKKLFDIEISITLKTKIKTTLIFLTLMYIMVISLSIINDLGILDSLLIFFFFYIINLIFLGAYFLIETFLLKMHDAKIKTELANK